MNFRTILVSQVLAWRVLQRRYVKHLLDMMASKDAEIENLHDEMRVQSEIGGE